MKRPGSRELRTNSLILPSAPGTVKNHGMNITLTLSVEGQAIVGHAQDFLSTVLLYFYPSFSLLLTLSPANSAELPAR